MTKTTVIEFEDRIGNQWKIEKRKVEGFPESYRIYKNGSIANETHALAYAVIWVGEKLTGH